MIESLITGEVYFSPPEMLNDPFDCQIDIQKSLDTAIKKVKGDDARVLLAIKERLNQFFPRLESDIKTFGVWSCSMELKNSLMWSHYGDDHKGVCLTYALPETFIDHTLGEVMGIHPIDYGENPIVDWFVEISKHQHAPDFGEFATDLTIKLLTSKDKCWEYEKEGRVISRDQGPKEIGKSALRQVCFGLRTPERDKKLLRSILENHGYNVTICEMIRSENDFGLLAKEI